MIKDYTMRTIDEAVFEQLSFKFIELIKSLDSATAARRIAALLSTNGHNCQFLNIVGQFNSLEMTKTSAD